MQHGDRFSDLLHKIDIMFHDNDRFVLHHGLDHFTGLIGFISRHSRSRFIQCNQARFLGDDHSHLQPLPFPMRQGGRNHILFSVQIDLFQNRLDFVGDRPVLSVQKCFQHAAVPGQRHLDIFIHRKVVKQVGALEFPSDSILSGDFMRAKASDVFAGKRNPSAGRRRFSRNHVDDRCLAGPIRADDNPGFPFRNRQGNLVHGQKTAEADADLMKFQKSHASHLPFRCRKIAGRQSQIVFVNSFATGLTIDFPRILPVKKRADHPFREKHDHGQHRDSQHQ